MAVILSHALPLPFLTEPTERSLIVDDIADSCRTLERFKGKNFIVTPYYHQQSLVVPDIWLREKKDAWIVFPWEKNDAA